MSSPKPVRWPVSRVAKRPAAGRPALDTGRLAGYSNPMNDPEVTMTVSQNLIAAPDCCP